MRPFLRHILLFTSIIAFLLVAPLLIFYAMGFRSGSNESSKAPVGVLLLESTPRRAEIKIDDASQGTTPEAITNLSPGKIDVSISKAGYLPWRKTISILPTTVTDFRFIKLFPADTSPLKLLNNINSFSLSPNRKLIAALAPKRLHVIDETGVPIISPVPYAKTIDRVLWSPDSNYLLLFSSLEVSIVDVSLISGSPKPLPKLLSSKNIAWDPRIPGRLLVHTNSDKLIAYSIATNTSMSLAENITSFATSSRQIYTITVDNQINILNLQGQHIRTLPSPPDNKVIDKLLVTPGNQAAIQFTDSSLAYFNGDNSYVPVTGQVLVAGWSPSGQLLYLQTDKNSLHIFNVLDEHLSFLPMNDQRLVVRLSRQISDPQWFAGGQHLIFQVADEIIISEIDTRDHPSFYTVDTTNLGHSLVTVGNEGKSVFYLKSDNGTNALVKKSLVVE